MTRAAVTSDTGRIEAFSDGVFAIAITLLALEIKVPQVHGEESLLSALGAQWPSYVAYVVSFLVLGIMWANHHTLFSYIARVDRLLMFLNLILLLILAALPWPTALVAEYLNEGGSASHIAAAVYSGFMVAQALAFQAFWWHATRTGRLLDPRFDHALAKKTRLRFALGSIAYPITFGLAFVSAPLTIVVHGLLAIYYGFNQLRIPAKME
jgi:uncharacterized membrane protein